MIHEDAKRDQWIIGEFKFQGTIYWKPWSFLASNIGVPLEFFSRLYHSKKKIRKLTLHVTPANITIYRWMISFIIIYISKFHLHPWNHITTCCIWHGPPRQLTVTCAAGCLGMKNPTAKHAKHAKRLVGLHRDDFRFFVMVFYKVSWKPFSYLNKSWIGWPLGFKILC